jgi:transcriptional regulator with XRE-family HTH domain
MTQQEFAISLGVAITTVARYETGRSPRGRILSKFAELAAENGRPDLSGIFKRRSVAELGSALGEEFREWLRMYRRSLSEEEYRRVKELSEQIRQQWQSIRPELKGESAVTGAALEDHLAEVFRIILKDNGRSTLDESSGDGGMV